MKTADARKYRPYRSDVVLDIRQIEIALRKLRAFAREGADRELDIEGTIDETAKNAGELEVVTRPPRRPNTRVILMMDVGGSMDPYFHNCVYGRVYKTEGFQDAVKVSDLLHECGKNYKLVIVGDAAMAPYELVGSPGWGEEGKVPGLGWLMMLREHFERSVWLNPDGIGVYPHPTVDAIARVFPMFALTLEGLGQGVHELVRGGRRA
jgi:uncharacterized protein with von Willebrand factor type A (vWA) domain